MKAQHLLRTAALASLTALATTLAAAATNDPSTGLPILANAVKLRYQTTAPINECGHNVTTTVYRTTTSTLANTFALYERALPGSTFTKFNLANAADHFSTTGYRILLRGGSIGVSLSQTTYTGAAGSLMAARSREVLIGLQRYSPPLSEGFHSDPKQCAAQ